MQHRKMRDGLSEASQTKGLKRPSQTFSYFLVDNGSLRPEAVLELRQLAAGLSLYTGVKVEPVSLLHSDAVDPAHLEGKPAETFVPALKKRLEAGFTDFIVLPLFFGPSAAVTQYLPRQAAVLKRSWPKLNVQIAPCLIDTTKTVENKGMVCLLHELVDALPVVSERRHPAVILVDHGTPMRSVNAVREEMTHQLAACLGDSVRCIAAASMERRPGPAYAFNDPLLENLLGSGEFGQGDVVIALLFLFPGRHAGPGGDIERICTQARSRCPRLRLHITAPVAHHPALPEVLAVRWHRFLHSGEAAFLRAEGV